MKDWLHRLLSDSSGIPDEARVGGMIIILTFCGCVITSVIMTPSHTFDMAQFGTGAGLLATGIGAWMGFRKDN